jgi:hypothetical protein
MVQKTLGNCSKRCAKGSMRQPMTLRCTPPAEGPTLSLLAATLFQYYFFCKCISCPVSFIFTRRLVYSSRLCTHPKCLSHCDILKALYTLSTSTCSSSRELPSHMPQVMPFGSPRLPAVRITVSKTLFFLVISPQFCVYSVVQTLRP